jgi:hypothetical protein
MRRSPRIAPAIVAGLAVLTAGCGEADRATMTTTRDSTSNERRLTRAESVRLVDWATAFRSCMVDRGTHVGRLAKHETRIEMALAANVEAADVLPGMTACGDKLGGPPQESSLQYRAGKVLLYLPKQCLLDANVAAS